MSKSTAASVTGTILPDDAGAASERCGPAAGELEHPPAERLGRGGGDDRALLAVGEAEPGRAPHGRDAGCAERAPPPLVTHEIARVEGHVDGELSAVLQDECGRTRVRRHRSARYDASTVVHGCHAATAGRHDVKIAVIMMSPSKFAPIMTGRS
jgi:hypothetical protein